MFRNIMRLFKQSAIYGIGTIVERLFSFLMLPLFLNILTKEEFGLYALWFSYLIIASPIYLLGINSALIRFYPETKAIREKQLVFSTAFWTIFLIVIGMTLLGLAVSAWLNQALFGDEYSAGMTYLLIAVLGLDSLNLLMLNLLKAENRALSFALISIGAGVCIPLITFYLLVSLKLAVIGALLAVGGVAFLKCLLLGVIVFPGHLRFRFSWSWFREMLHFGLPFVPTILAASLMVSIDRILLNQFWGKEMVGIYAAGFRLAMIISLFTKAFQYAWEPFIAVTWQQKNAPELFAKIFTYFLLITGFIFLGLALFVGEVVRFQIGRFTFFGPEYYESTRIVPIIMLGSIFYGCYLNFIIGVYIRKRSIYFALLTLLGVAINGLLNIILIPVWDIIGAAWATVFAYAAMMAGMYILNQKFYPTPYEFGRLLKIGLLFSVFYLLPNLLSIEFSPIWKLCFLLIIPFLLYGFGFFEKSELNRFKQLFKGRTWPNLF